MEAGNGRLKNDGFRMLSGLDGNRDFFWKTRWDVAHNCRTSTESPSVDLIRPRKRSKSKMEGPMQIGNDWDTFTGISNSFEANYGNSSTNSMSHNVAF